MTNRERLILFDIDFTLIDRDKLVGLQKQTLATAAKVTLETLEQLFEEYYATLEKTSDFSPDDLMGFLAKKLQLSKEQLLDTYFQPANFQASLYTDVLPTLTSLRNKKHPLGLYSEGNQTLQEFKMLANNLLKMFDPRHRHIMKRKMDPQLIEDLPEGTIVIDDRLSVMAFLEAFPHIVALHLVRNADNPVGEYTLSTLNDLFPILNALRHP